MVIVDPDALERVAPRRGATVKDDADAQDAGQDVRRGTERQVDRRAAVRPHPIVETIVPGERDERSRTKRRSITTTSRARGVRVT
jgi:hypothetical protein